MKFELPHVAKKAINALPDLREEPPQFQALAAIMGSVAVHIFVLLIWLSLQNGWIEKLLRAIPKPEAPLELVFAPLPPPEKMVVPLDQLREKERVDSAALSEAPKPRPDATFQSDRNLAAGSTSKPAGAAPQPSADGRNTAVKTLASQEAKAGSSSNPKSKSSNTPPPMSKTTASKVASLSKKPAARPEVGAQTERGKKEKKKKKEKEKRKKKVLFSEKCFSGEVHAVIVETILLIIVSIINLEY